MLNNFNGYDISPDMVRLSLVNLYLHGFVNPQVYEYDTLSSDERWNEYADVILANPPFMSPKGGIKPHKRFSVQSSRSEVLFVDYMAEHLTPTGRAGIIVPEGIVFITSKAYKQLRKYLVDENILWAVVSLPAGVFNPYSGVKTSILLMDKTLAKKTDKIMFVKVEADGFDLGAQRHPNGKNDLPDALDTLRNWQTAITHNQTDAFDASSTTLPGLLVPKKALANTDWILSGERYKVSAAKKTKWGLVELGEVLDYEQPTKYIVASTNYNNNYKTPVLTAGKSFILGYTDEDTGIFIDGLPVIIFDDFTTATKFVDFPFKVKSSAMKILHAKKDKAIPKFVYYTMQNIDFPINEHKRYWISQYSKIKIPLPPLNIQIQIVDEVRSYEHIIDGARQVVEGWKPNLELELYEARKYAGVEEWERDTIENVCDFIDYRGKTPKKTDSGIRLITAKNVKMGLFSDEPREYIADYEAWMTRGYPKKGDVLFTTEAPLGNVVIIDIDDEKFAVGQRIITLQCHDEIINSIFLANVLMSKETQTMIHRMSTGSTVKGILAKYFRKIDIPLPPLEVQREIVSRIEVEREIVEANKRLIEIYEGKIKQVISRVWEG